MIPTHRPAPGRPHCSSGQAWSSVRARSPASWGSRRGRAAARRSAAAVAAPGPRPARSRPAARWTPRSPSAPPARPSTPRTVVLAPGEAQEWHRHPGTEMAIVRTGAVMPRARRRLHAGPLRRGAGAVRRRRRRRTGSPTTAPEPAELVVTTLLAPDAPEDEGRRRPARRTDQNRPLVATSATAERLCAIVEPERARGPARPHGEARGGMRARTVAGADGRTWSVRRNIEWKTPATGAEFEHDVDGGRGAVLLILSALFLFWVVLILWTPPLVPSPGSCGCSRS